MARGEEMRPPLRSERISAPSAPVLFVSVSLTVRNDVDFVGSLYPFHIELIMADLPLALR